MRASIQGGKSKIQELFIGRTHFYTYHNWILQSALEYPALEELSPWIVPYFSQLILGKIRIGIIGLKDIIGLNDTIDTFKTSMCLNWGSSISAYFNALDHLYSFFFTMQNRHFFFFFWEISWAKTVIYSTKSINQWINRWF